MDRYEEIQRRNESHIKYLIFFFAWLCLLLDIELANFQLVHLWSNCSRFDRCDLKCSRFSCWHIEKVSLHKLNPPFSHFNCGTFGFDLSRPRNSSRTSSSLAISKSSKSLKKKFKLVITMATSHPSKLLAVENLGRNHVALALLLFPPLPHERPLVLKNIWPQALNCWNTKDLRTWFPGNIMSTSSKAIFLIWKCLPICVTYSIKFHFTCKTLWICCCSLSI